MFHKIALILIQAIELYSYILIIWIIGSWFPQLHNTGFYRFIDRIVYPYASIFRKFIPPLGGFDFSVIIAYFALTLLQRIVATILL